MVTFKFSKPVVAEHVSINSSPHIELKAQVFDHEPNSLVLIPYNDLWQLKTNYTIIIRGVQGVNGEKLEKGYIEYKYFNDSPANIDYAGEDFN